MGALTTSLFAGQVLRVDLEIEPHRLAMRGYALWLGSIEMTKFFFIVTDHLLHFGIPPTFPLSIIVSSVYNCPDLLSAQGDNPTSSGSTPPQSTRTCLNN